MGRWTKANKDDPLIRMLALAHTWLGERPRSLRLVKVTL